MYKRNFDYEPEKRDIFYLQVATADKQSTLWFFLSMHTILK
jgi:hypothetical protein